jgi:hypothetical protein
MPAFTRVVRRNAKKDGLPGRNSDGRTDVYKATLGYSFNFRRGTGSLRSCLRIPRSLWQRASENETSKVWISNHLVHSGDFVLRATVWYAVGKYCNRKSAVILEVKPYPRRRLIRTPRRTRAKAIEFDLYEWTSSIDNEIYTGATALPLQAGRCDEQQQKTNRNYKSWPRFHLVSLGDRGVMPTSDR